MPLLGVLPGTGGLTRLSDKRKIRRDHADIFCTVAEGIKGKRAVEWRFVDKLISKSKWQEGVMSEAILLSSQTAKSKMDSSLQLNDQGPRNNKAVELKYLDSKITDSPELFSKTYSHVEFRVFKETRKAEVKLLSPKPEAELKKWALQTYRELNDAILNLRANFSEIGLWEFKTEGDANKILEAEKNLPHETVSFIKRTLRRVEVSSRSIVTLIEQNSCFSGSLAELVFIADRSFMLEESADVVLSHMNLKQLPMHNGLSRLEARYEYDLELFEKITAMSRDQSFSAEDCEELGLVTAVLDDIDYPDEVRLFEEERASMSPDALVGLEANLRYVGPENMATRIFGRLSAWQNWIFTRENACGPKGALTNYATPTKPEFDLRRC